MNSKTYKTIINIIATISVAMMFFSCKNNLETVAALSDTSKLPIQTAINLNVSYSDSSYVKMNLIAPKMEYYNTEDPYREFTEGLTVYQFNANGDTTLNIRAKYAIYNEKTEIWEAKHDVVVNNGEKTLFSEQLFWDTKQHTIYTDAHYKLIMNKDVTLYGKGLESDESLKKPIFKNTTADMYYEDKEQK